MPEHQSDVYDSQLYQSLIILNDVFHTSVPEILNLYNDRHHNPLFYQISFKQGNLSNGLRWISTHHFDTNVTGEKQIIYHVFNKYGESLVKQICKNLVDENINYHTKHQLLRLIGYTKNTIFANSIRTAWRFIPDDKKDYRMFFWAAARACDDDPHSLLKPIFDYWESLSDEENEYHSTDRASFAAHGLKWKFSEYVPHRSIAFMLQEAEKRDSLNFYILYMLSEVDNADVLEAQATRLANSRRQGNYMPSAVLDSLFRNSENGKILSIESKQRLLSISENLDNDDFLRQSAFRLWEMSPNYDDLFILRQIVKNDVRFEIALMGRAKRKDFTAIDGLVKKINEDPWYWWQATRYIWHKDFEKLLEEKVASIDDTSDLEIFWIIDELFEKLEIQKAESLLINYWDNLSNHSKFIQIALMIATPKLQKLIAKEFESTSNIASSFDLFGSTLGIMTKGRKSIYRHEQMKAIEPYFEYIDEGYLFEFASICLKKGWSDVFSNIIPLLKGGSYSRVVVIDTTDLETAYNAKTDLEHLKIDFLLYDWIKSQKRVGWSHEKIIKALFHWFNSYQNNQALKVISKPLRQSGKRTDYVCLESTLKDMTELPDKQKVLDKLYFNIYSRSLD